MNQRSLVKPFALSLGICGLLMALEKSAFAQLQNSQEPPIYQNSEQDPNKGAFSGFDPASLIHNANLSRSRNGVDFAEDTQQNLNKAANDFKRQQQLLLKNQPVQATPPTPATVPPKP
jgi:hypothetical protein